MKNAMSNATISLLVLPVLIGGCATNQGYLEPNTGVALREAYAKQIVDPDPIPGAPMIRPEKARAAIERYLNDEVKDPTPEDQSFITVE